MRDGALRLATKKAGRGSPKCPPRLVSLAMTSRGFVCRETLCRPVSAGRQTGQPPGRPGPILNTIIPWTRPRPAAPLLDFQAGRGRPSYMSSEPFRNPDYLAYIRRQPCLVCGGACGPSEAHHEYGHGTSIKGSDFRALPLGTKHHRERHDKGRRFWDEYNIDPTAEMMRLLEWYLVFNGHGKPPGNPRQRPPERPAKR